MNNHQRLITELSDNGYESYALTMTYKLSGYMQERFDDDVLYQKYRYRFIDTCHHHDDLAAKLEEISKRVFNQFYCKLLNNRNITKNRFNPLRPIIFYRFELMPADERWHGLQNVPGFRNICPVHLHAVAMIPSRVDTTAFTGDDSLLQFHNALQSSQLIKLNSLRDQEKWFGYINKGAAHDPFFGYGDIHPVKFKDDPWQFISNIKDITEHNVSGTVH